MSHGKVLVNSDGNGGFSYDFIDKNGDDYYCGNTSRDVVENTKSYLDQEYFPRVREQSARSFLRNGEYRAVLRNLQGCGFHIYENFIPVDLRERINALDDASLLHIKSNEMWLPWELIRNGSDFWGKRFVISRSHRNVNVSIREKQIQVKKIINVIGAGISNEVSKRAEKLFENHPDARVINILGNEDSESLDKIYEQIGNADIIHFTCHGYVSQSDGNLYLQVVRDKAPTYNFMVTTIATLSIKPNALIFANACSSAQSQLAIQGSMGFGREFCSGRHEASAFIGALDLIPDFPAVLFAEEFYKNIFHGNNVGQALRLAKQVGVRTDDGHIGMFQLLYSLYGNPLAIIKMN